MDVVKNMFFQTMQREGKSVTLFNGKEEFEAFFRRNNDGMNEKNTLVMYYPATAPVKAGKLLSYNNKTMLALNRETVENEVYMKSGLVETNGVINTNSHSVVGLPFYGDTNVNNAMAQSDSHLSVIDGNISILTEDCALSRQLKINDTLNEWGRTWKISNIFYIDGMCHIALEVTENEAPVEINYTVKITGLEYYNVAPTDTAQIQAVAYANDAAVESSTIEYSSSDEQVATINQDGDITYLSDGSVYFTAHWVEQDITANTETVTVVSAPEDKTVEIFVTPLDTIYAGEPETLTYYAVQGGVRDDSIAVKFKVENLNVTNNYNVWVKKIKITDNGNHTITLEADTALLQKRFDLVAYIDGTDVENRQNIYIDSLF